MHQALKRAGWKLMLAGALAGATSAASLAQTLPDQGMDAQPFEAGSGRIVALVGTPNGQPHLTIKNGTGAATSPAAARLAEIKAELAWLADPATCPCALTAHAFGQTLEVRGAVPTEAVRAQAIKLAQEQSTLAVMDALQVQPDLAMPQPIHEPAENLAMTAATAFNETVPSYCFGVNIGALSNGTITVEGMIPSYEEKLRVSQRLHRLRGCTCIVNKLVVSTLQRDGRPSAQVTADGQLWVPAEPTAGQPTRSMPAVPVAQAGRTSYPVAQPVPVQHERPHGLIAWVKDKMGIGSRTAVEEDDTADSSALSRSRWTTMPPRPALPTPTASRWSSATPVASATPSVPLSPYAGFPNRVVMPMATDVDSANESMTPVSAPVTVLPAATVGNAAPVFSSAPVPAPRTVVHAEPSRPPAVQVVDWKTNEPAMLPVGSPPSLGVPKGVTTAAEPADPAPHVPARAVAAQVKQRVQATGGPAARDVEVIARSDVNLLIRLKVADVTTGERLGPQILAIPELEPYHVDLEVQIQR
jgi:hypothetical protein